ncbi:MAG: tetratricopeptide repeat protein [Phycisphaerales bacterium]|nr:tetratricopeptide repeat protein [Phycisphaerales bacterium]
MTRLPFYLLLCLLLMLTGCATKRYGRMQPVSATERQQLSCREIDIEIAKTREFLDQINAEGFDGRDVLGILGDFGIGNAMERGDAVKSGKKRLDELEALRVEKGCPGSGSQPTAIQINSSYSGPSAQAQGSSEFERALRGKDAGQLAELAAYYEDLLSVEPNGIAARRNLAMIRYQQGEYEEAWKHVKHLHLLGTNVPGDFEARLAAAMPKS